MGEIWSAEDTRLGRKIALKLLPPELAWHPHSKSRFLLEARAASALDHPNICSIYEVGETADHQLYLVMPCYEGELLRDRIERGPLPIAEVLDLAGQIAQGLAEAHRKGIVHRDVKPANLMITGNSTLKILDFGIAKLAGAAGITRAGAVVGTLAYMSPEQIRGEAVDGRSDLWSLGVVLYEMLTGRHPFPGDQEVVTREAILHGRPAPLKRGRPDIPGGLEKLVAALLEKDPAGRVPSAERVTAALRELAGEAARAPVKTVKPQMPGWRRGIVLFLPGLLLTVTFIAFWKGIPAGVWNLVAGAPASATAAPSSNQPKSVVVLGFRNLSEDASARWLGPALTEILTAELAAGGRFRVISSERAAQARKSLNLPDKPKLDREAVGRLRALVGADLVVTGTYLPLGEGGRRQLRVDVRVLNAPAGETLAAAAEVGREPELFDLVARTEFVLRRALGVSPPTAEERSQARCLLPAGPEAIHLYTEALSRLWSSDLAEARDLLLRAEALEPESVVIQSALSEIWLQLGQDNLARSSALRAFSGRPSLPREAQLLIEARFYEAGKQWDQASGTYRSLQIRYPDELKYSLKLADTLSMGGHGLEALAVLAQTHERPAPDGNDPRIDLAEATAAWRLSDLPRTERAADAAIAKGQSSGSRLTVARGLIFKAYVAGAKGKPGEAIDMLRQGEALALQAGDRLTAGLADFHLGRILIQQGYLDEAEEVEQKALTAARELGTAIGISAQLRILGQLRQERGDLEGARALLEQAWTLSHQIYDRNRASREGGTLAAVLLAQGDIDGARQVLTEMLESSRSGEIPEGELQALQGSAELKAQEGKLDEALQLQERALLILLRLRRPSLSAGGLSLSADLLARSGNLPLARRRFFLAEAAGRHAADRLVSARLLGTKAWFAFQAGDLATAWTESEEQLRLAREIHASPLETAALRELARNRRGAGDTAQARNLLWEAQHIAEMSGDRLAWMEISLARARLDLDNGDAAGALELARGAAQWSEARRFGRGESKALALAAEALSRLGRTAEARQAATRARSLAPEMDRELHLEIVPALARVDATGGDAAGAIRELDQAVEEAGRLGFVPAGFEARLARGEILMRRGQSAGRPALESLQKESESKGFLLIARRAAVLLAGG